LRKRPFAHKIADAVRDKARQLLRHPIDRMARQVHAERVARAGQPQRLAPIRLRGDLQPLQRRRALLGSQAKEIHLSRFVRARVLIATLHGTCKARH
jgi:hypothetical protein